jgi:Acetoacetate decarboxylase (ADC)
MEQRELVTVPGVPESALTAEMFSQLPNSAPAAPWAGTASVVMWLTRGGKAATQALPPKLRSEVSALGVLAGMVHYRETPVGTYGEVFGNVGFLRRAQPRAVVSFMAVDSPASLVGGRSNWSLPKTLASFDGEPAPGRTMTGVGRDWKVSAKVTSLGPAIPMRSSVRLEQEWPEGIVRPCTMRFRGRGRLALVTVHVEAQGSLSTWLKSGRHPGMVFETVKFTMSPPGEPTRT